jgi:sterol desaturase/sphingolipid hydroxylase (fatty acid hydroxylase superfamily)
MIKALNDIQPFIIILLLTLFIALETFIPYITQYKSRRKHTVRNLALVFFSFMCYGITGSWFVFWLPFIKQHQIGLLNILNAGPVISIIAGIFLADLDAYILHVVSHRSSFLWRFHRIHHSDNELDSTSSLRIHPFEVFILAAWRTVTFTLLGISLGSFVVFFTVLLPVVFIQHANIRFPNWIEKPLGFIFATSAWHKVHHSDEQNYTDSHYGDLFSFWDRIFGTYHKKVNVEKLNWGLKEFNEDKYQKVLNQLMLPFK